MTDSESMDPVELGKKKSPEERGIRLATIGSSKIMRNFLKAAEYCPEIKPSVLYSRTKENAERLAEDGNLTDVEICTSFEELQNHPGVGAVYVASPTFLHCEQAVAMLDGGRHVLCEKPAASNYKEWMRMQEAARRAKRVLLEAMRPLFTPGFAVLKDNLYRTGKIRKVFLQYCQYSSRYDKFKQGIVENAFRPELSNGALTDIGIYCIEVMVGLLGIPEKITASSVILPGSIDGEGTILAEYSGTQAVLSYSKISDSGLSCEIQGEEGTLTWESIRFPENIRFVPRGGNAVLLFGKTPVPDMAYEQREFLRLCREAEGEETAENGTSGFRVSQDFCNTVTGESLKIADEARRQCKIVFPADL